MENKINKSIQQALENNTVNGNVVNKQNNQNNINKDKIINTKVIKVPSKKHNKKDKRVLFTAHAGIENLRLRETSPKTPREVLKKLWDKGVREIENVSFFVKGYLEDSDNRMVTVENVCSSKLLTYHCNLIVDDNPDIVNYIGKVVMFDIELYQYPNNPDKLSFNIIGEPKYCESPDYYSNSIFELNIERRFTFDNNEYISSMLKASSEYKIRYINSIITDMNYISDVLFWNEHLISNLILNSLMVSLDIDDRIIYENDMFINKYFYDIIMIYVKIYNDIFDKELRSYVELKDHILTIVGIYTDSPYINSGRITEEFLRMCVYLNITNKQARFYYGLFDLKDKPSYSYDDRVDIIEEMKQLIIDYSYTV